MKIRIIGHAGSGKTTLSKEIAKKYGYQSIPLDSFLKYKDKKRRKRKLNKEMKKHPSWIVEGVQDQKWCRKTIVDADLVIILDYPLWIVQYRVLKRTVQGMKGASSERKKFLKKRAKSLIKWNKKFTKNMPNLKQSIYSNNSNLYIIRSPKDIERVYTIIGFYMD